MPMSYLEIQKDFEVLSNKTFTFPNKGDESFSETVPDRIYSCGVEWVVGIIWGDVVFSDHTYSYSSVSTDNIYFNEKVMIITVISDLLKFKASEQYVLWHGSPVYYQDTYSEMFNVDLSVYLDYISQAHSKEECVSRIKEILKNENPTK